MGAVRLELEIGTDVLLLEFGDALLLENSLAQSSGGSTRLGGRSFPAFRRLHGVYSKMGELPPSSLLNNYFVGADGNFHRNGSVMGVDGKYRFPIRRRK